MILQWWGYMYFHDLITEQIKTVILTLFPCKLQWLELGRAAAQIISGDVFFFYAIYFETLATVVEWNSVTWDLILAAILKFVLFYKDVIIWNVYTLFASF